MFHLTSGKISAFRKFFNFILLETKTTWVSEILSKTSFTSTYQKWTWIASYWQIESFTSIDTYQPYEHYVTSTVPSHSVQCYVPDIRESYTFKNDFNMSFRRIETVTRTIFHFPVQSLIHFSVRQLICVSERASVPSEKTDRKVGVSYRRILLDASSDKVHLGPLCAFSFYD